MRKQLEPESLKAEPGTEVTPRARALHFPRQAHRADRGLLQVDGDVAAHEVALRARERELLGSRHL